MRTITTRSVSTRAIAGAASALFALCAQTAFAATPGPAAEIQARYEQERAKCLDGTSNQDRATCLKEAGASREAARRGLLNTGDETYRRNAKARCDALGGDEARDCLARMKGQGTTSGSAQAGGIYRELTTGEEKPAEPAASAVPAN
jgi:hypothetical protein